MISYLLLCILLSPTYIKSSITLDSSRDSLSQLIEANLLNKNQQICLNLGYVKNYLSDYINIASLADDTTIRSEVAADVYTDIIALNFPEKSISEIRSHFLLECFDRQTAVALLCKWHTWLKIGGTLCIEIADFEQYAIAFINAHTLQEKQLIIRQIFGSQETNQTFHYDGWFQEKYQHYLNLLGFDTICFERTRFSDNYGIKITAKKKKHFSKLQRFKLAKKCLQEYCIDSSPSEKKLHKTWLTDFNSFSKKMALKKSPFILITTLYNETNHERVKEYITCLEKNLRHPLIDKIHVLYDTTKDD